VLTNSDRAEMVQDGGLRPMYERQVRTLEAISEELGGFSDVSLNGFSLGGLLALGVASIGSSELPVSSINVIDAPDRPRTPEQLQKHFLKSASPKEQLQAIRDARMPVIAEALALHRLALDYARFGVADKTNKDSKVIKIGMAKPRFEQLVEQALANYAEARIRIGHITGSLVSSELTGIVLANDSVSAETYSGPGSHRHATVDNPVAVSLMFR